MASVQRADGMRGTGLLALLAIEQRRAGRDSLRGRLERAPPPVVARLRLDEGMYGVDPNAWYEPAFVHGVVDAVSAGQVSSVMRDVTREAARNAVAAAMEVRPTFATLDTTERVSRLLNAVWRSAFSDGSIRVIALGPRKVEVHRTGWTGHHPLICRFGMEAAGALYELAGHTTTKVTPTACVSDGRPECTALIDW